MPGPILVLLLAWLAVVVVGAVVTGWFWLTLVGLAMVLTTGALGVAEHLGRSPRT
ncbi:hypothetical protein SAMN06893096_11386 [Geodermatophilus pulveris]|uniref:Uncharacterized protein n=1 Tax=Geodermatophilus pulveris TaxID=1564159 RepID=A0A239JES9_9ACTN|nr:hypothetical protein [Geodermatophilus pulveris]SNT03204.1 hypothetical protein SAMN06893096_11386 [Geodermatophilus pulveris]